MRTGEFLGFVFAASADRKIWTLNSAPRTMADYVPSDAGRQALELCEFEAGRPCAILSVNGFQARQSADSAPRRKCCSAGRANSIQPSCRSWPLPHGRSGRVPKGPRPARLCADDQWVLALARCADRQAIDRTMADCAAQFKPAACLLYAVGDRVVFVAR